MFLTLKEIILKNLKEQVFKLLKLSSIQFKNYFEGQNLYWILSIDSSKPYLLLLRKMFSLQIMKQICLPTNLFRIYKRFEESKFVGEVHYCCDKRVQISRCLVNNSVEYFNSLKPKNGCFNITVPIFNIIGILDKVKDEIITSIILNTNNKILFKEIIKIYPKYETTILFKVGGKL